MKRNNEERINKLTAVLLAASIAFAGGGTGYVCGKIGESSGIEKGKDQAFNSLRSSGYHLVSDNEYQIIVNSKNNNSTNEVNNVLLQAKNGFVIQPDGKTCTLSNELGTNESYEFQEDGTVLFTTVETIGANYDPVSKRFVAPDGYVLKGQDSNLAVKTTKSVKYFDVNCSQMGGVYLVDEYSVTDAEMILSDFSNPDGTRGFGDVLPYVPSDSILAGEKALKNVGQYYVTDNGENYSVAKRETMVTSAPARVDEDGKVTYYCADGGVLEFIDGKPVSVTYRYYEVEGAKAEVIIQHVKDYNMGKISEDENSLKRSIND